MAGSTDGEGTVWRGAVRISGCLGALAKADADKRVAAELARAELAAAQPKAEEETRAEERAAQAAGGGKLEDDNGGPGCMPG